MGEERLIISHVRESDKEIQTNDEHQQGVAKMAESFAAEFGMGDFGKVMGLLHDKGKEQSEWQKYIQGVTGYKPEYAYVKKGPHHAYVGAVIAKKLYPSIYPLIAQPIAGHHRGLYDYNDYE
jgi:CRISPR-associated endonuclease/helicase Cas3